MKISNKHIYSIDQEYLKTLKEEYFQLGFDTDLSTGHLTVFTIRRKKPKVEKEDKNARRNER